ncbi:MAG TPA: SDR family oxidoreductase [Thermoanaerobaculia bacterium]|nr:SDR family oxidoreductase [Thermoanaerobaculia bacterium]
MNPFHDAVAVVTGGASGLGRAFCEELARRGARVVVTDIGEEGARAVAAAIVAAGGQATAARLDVTRAEDVQRLLEETSATHGRLDYLFNNAGLAVSGEVRDLSLEHWRRIIDVNLWGVIHGATAAYALMTRQGSGHIVNVASLAGLTGFPTATPYATTKFGVVGLSLSLRAEGEGLGVKVTAVCPGFVKTSIFDAGTYVRSRKEDVLASIPFKMIGAADAARQTLDGVARNRAVIVYPFYGRVMWWMTRLSYSLAALLHAQTVGRFRAKRGKLPV